MPKKNSNLFESIKNTFKKKRKISKGKIRCPKCGSTQFHVDKSGYGAGKGCCGTLIFGPFGLLCGQVGANKIRKTCLRCNHGWT